ncbi:103R [Invertebrate iridescent virus Kaz2018]|uniref:103R n=1 Tax=Invertebrate iridescent virus 6 TaxID=176652 RepID=Q91G17_IIV6|nr:103R [Invertebrate iridescent virus 6]AAK82015.1 103R [Invertebrate iridescent virus 6]QNH08513.1 103R [Invertebrate iridescent virus Kaz2018]
MLLFSISLSFDSTDETDLDETSLYPFFSLEFFILSHSLNGLDITVEL